MRSHLPTKPQIDLPIYSPVSGIVTERKVTQGQYVNAGEVLFTVTDLSRVWVKADVYQPDLPSRSTSARSVEITSDSLPGAKLRARLDSSNSMVNPQTRTTSPASRFRIPACDSVPACSCRFDLPTLRTPHTRRAALRGLDTGMRKLVYVAKGNGVFEGREVQLGPVATTTTRSRRLARRRPHRQPRQFPDRLPDSNQRRHERDVRRIKGIRSTASRLPKPRRSWKVRSAVIRQRLTAAAEATLHVSVHDASGKPVTDAQVKVTSFMPAMPAMGMGEMREAAT